MENKNTTLKAFIETYEKHRQRKKIRENARNESEKPWGSKLKGLRGEFIRFSRPDGFALWRENKIRRIKNDREKAKTSSDSDS